MLRRFVKLIGGDPNKREIEKFSQIVDQINDLEPEYEALSNEALRQKTDEFRQRIASQTEGIFDDKELFKAEQAVVDEILPEAFAAVREASKRTIGLRHFDVQLIGGITLHQGKIAEMRTGEGKTLVATLPLYLNAISGHGVHLVTVNDYLARRDARWMAPIYNLLGLNVGVLQMAARTENGKKAFLVDLEKTSPHEDQNQLRMVPRAEAYTVDITYGTNSEFGFDYLRDNMTMSLEERVQRGHHYAIVDEVDNVLIDEARTPLIISGPANDEAEFYYRMAQMTRLLRPEDYEVDEKDRTVTLSELGQAHVNDLLGEEIYPDTPELSSPYQDLMQGYSEQALRAQFLYRRNKDYLVQAGKVVIVDEFTGRLMPGRRWSDGLHQAVEAKEGAKVQSESVTYATITIQNYFRMYKKLAGMSGTAITEAEEFDKIYKLGVLAIPTNLEYMATRNQTGLEETEDRDEDGYKIQFYITSGDPENKPVFWKRQDFPDVVYRNQEAKLRSIAREILRYHVMGRPLLVGTTSVELSERVSTRLRAEPLRRLVQVLMLREAYRIKNALEDDGRQVAELQFLNTPLDELDLSAMRKLARELDLALNPEDPNNLERLIELFDLTVVQKPRLMAVLQAGIPHQVLNARKHTEESQIIAGAGAFGAVTIATNMAGRGVDIKLGGELAEEVLAAVNRVLARAGYKDPYDMTMQQRQQALEEMGPDGYGIYGAEVDFFFQYMTEMELVRALGGLHVIGSERHEARRIDNQLRGRAARQGDPGSSRFYLSMEDELMRLFGGGQADSMMQRLKIDDSMPLEVGLVGRLVEQSQTRVEGANFDIRKHLLEYDDVLNTQRTYIYAQRDKIFTKGDLTEDVTEMLRAEVGQHVTNALSEEGGAWKLLYWLDQVQPSISFGNGVVFPSFTYRLLLKEFQQRLSNGGDVNTLREAMLDVAARSLETEGQHQLQDIAKLVEQSEEKLDSLIEERMDAIDAFFEGLSYEDEEGQPIKTADLLAVLNNTAHITIKLSSQDQRNLKDDPEALAEVVRQQVEDSLAAQAVIRLVGAVERRLEDSIAINPSELVEEDWASTTEKILHAAQTVLNERRERYLGSNGQITKDVENALARLEGQVYEQSMLQLLLMMPQGARAGFDRKTHRRTMQRMTRLTYLFYASTLLEGREPDDIADEVLEHLEKAQETIHQGWGLTELLRLGNTCLNELEEATRQAVERALAEKGYQPSLDVPLNDLPNEQKEVLITELGRMALTGVYRQLLLGVTTELWVDYLTQMEALRVSIGLEAYAQRDPLVQYKNRAYELYQNLLKDMRLGVVSRMFVYRPHDLSRVQTALARPENPPVESLVEESPPDESELAQEEFAEEAEESEPVAQSATAQAGTKLERNGKKRRRRRH